MANAKQEFLNHLIDTATKGRIVNCAKIAVHRSVVTNHSLCVNYTKEEQELFLESLDFMYDSGYGGSDALWYDLVH